jgi:hypothetical protein
MGRPRTFLQQPPLSAAPGSHFRFARPSASL